MNLEVTLFMLVLLGLAIWGSQRLMKEAGKEETSEKDGKSLKVFAWIIRGVIIFIAVILLDRFGIVEIPNPFDGPKVENSMPSSGYQPEKAVAPEIEAVDGRPNMDEVREEHQKQLDDFEGKDE